ncbi:transposase, MuDR [Tanacetum coccineum]
MEGEENNPNLFSLKINHGGRFSYVYGLKRTRAPRCVYKGGNVDWFDDVDADGFSVIEVSCMLKELGYDNPKMKIHYKKPTSDLEKGLEPLSKDIDVLDLLSYVHKFKLIELFIEHHVDTFVLDTFVIDLDHEDEFDEGLESGKGIIPALAETSPCVEHRNIKELKSASKDVYDWLKLIPPQHWARPHYDVLLNNICLRYPCNGPDLWHPSDSLIILTPPDYHTPIGRPPKKRKKRDAELYDGMVKDGKLSRSGKTVTCLKCGEKGHNSRSCKGQRGAQSTQIPSQATMNPSAPAVNVTPSA